MKFIGQVLPIDGYYAFLKSELPYDYSKSLTHLYQPLIGIQAVMLYQTLLNDIDIKENELQTHHTLMSYLNLPLDEVYKARLKLEAIGLIQTYKKSEENRTIYAYELIRPFAPNEFFKDAMLSQLLYHQIGEQKFSLLKKHFVHEKIENLGNNITAAFHDVFQTFTPTLEVVSANEVTEELFSKNNASKLDFSWISQMLKQRMIPTTKVLTPQNKKILDQMAVLYDLDGTDVEKALIWALNDENELNINEFKVACHDLFKGKYKQTNIKLVERQNVQEEKSHNEPKTKEEMLIQELETISPKQLLEDLSGGNQASEQDMKIIREVMTSQGLPAPVMNVLIHYVLLQSNMKLSKAYMEKIASHWSRANIKTAKEAMEFAKKEQAKFKTSSNNNNKYKSNKTNYNYKPKGKKDIVPDWFKERKKQQKGQERTVVDIETNKVELEKMLHERLQQNNRF